MLAIVLMLPGACGQQQYDGFDWYKTDRPELAPIWVAVGVDGVTTRCKFAVPDNQVPVACADVVHGRVIGQCWIFADKPKDQQPVWVIKHEEKHCAGYDHR